MNESRIEMVGSLGVGKTTLLHSVQKYGKHSRIQFVYENLKNIKSERQYWVKNKLQRTYFIQSVYYLASHAMLIPTSRQHPVQISDFSLYGHHLIYSTTFYRLGMLSKMEFTTLSRLLEILLRNLAPVQACIVLKIPLPEQVERIKYRRRGKEDMTFLNLLKVLGEEVEHFGSRIDVPCFNLDTTNPLPSVSTEFRKIIQHIY